jgi:C1A family cysteine protease
MKRVLNWRPSPADARDLKLMNMRAMRGASPLETLPASWSLRDKCTPVRDQGQTGECTGQSVCGAEEFLSLKTSANTFVRKSVKFSYYNGRRTMFPSQVHVDSGCYIRTVIKAAARYGICEETLWPESNYFAAKPSVAAYADASRFQILEYGSLTGGTPSQTVDNIRRSIYQGLPVCFGFDVYASFMSSAVASSGVAPIPKAAEVKEGGHAVMAVGYDDDASMLLVRNSWGENWGDHGYFKLPYWFVLNGHASDFWAISAQENGEAEAGWFSGVPGYLFGHSERGSV